MVGASLTALMVTVLVTVVLSLPPNASAVAIDQRPGDRAGPPVGRVAAAVGVGHRLDQLGDRRRRRVGIEGEDEIAAAGAAAGEGGDLGAADGDRAGADRDLAVGLDDRAGPGPRPGRR